MTAVQILLRRSRVFACWTGVAVWTAGCQSYTPDPQLTQPAVTARWLAWLQDGQTNRQAVTRQLGEPTRSYEGRRIVAYHLYLADPHKQVTDQNFVKLNAKGFGPIRADTQMCVAPAHTTTETELRIRLSAAHYSLVLVYDPRDVVRTHSLQWRAP